MEWSSLKQKNISGKVLSYKDWNIATDKTRRLDVNKINSRINLLLIY